MKKLESAKNSINRNSEGSTALEFALLVPVFLMIILGVMQLSVAFHNANTAQWAVERAARAVLVSPDMSESDIQALVNEKLSAIHTGREFRISYAKNTSGLSSYGTISGTYSHEIEILMLPSFDLSFDVKASIPIT